MSANLIDLVSRAITPDTLQGLSRFLGESDSAVQSGIGTLVPALLGGLASKASTPSGASSLFSMINSPEIPTDLTSQVGSLLGSGQSNSLLQTGSSLLGGLFGGDKVSGVASALAGITGMKTGSASNLLMMAVPLVFSVIKRFIGESRLDSGGLAALLTGQKDFLQGKLDPRITSALGLGTPSGLLAGLGDTVTGAARSAATATASVAAGAGTAAVAGASGLRRLWPWLLGAVVALLLLMQLPRCTTATREAPPVAATTPAPAPEAMPAPAAGRVTTAPSLPAKVYFETGKAEISPEGTGVIASVAEMLAANPSAKVDITGYTDKSGDVAANEELAKNRAMSVKAALASAGVAPERVGTKPPMFVEIGAGSTDAEARRVDISVQ